MWAHQIIEDIKSENRKIVCELPSYGAARAFAINSLKTARVFMVGDYGTFRCVLGKKGFTIYAVTLKHLPKKTSCSENALAHTGGNLI